LDEHYFPGLLLVLTKWLGNSFAIVLPKPGSTNPIVLPKQPAINAITVKQK
jgi:hypothetical protein